jgi:ATP phosphoribosyltransferase
MKRISLVLADGSMQEYLIELLNQAQLGLSIPKPRTKEGRVRVDWIEEVFFQRPQEIPKYLAKSLFDVAICGQDWIKNWNLEFPELLRIPVGRKSDCPVKIVLAVSKESQIENLEDLPKNSVVATEYVELSENFFAGIERKDIEVVRSYGNTEQKITLGQATAIIDVTETGESIEANDLKIIFELMESNTVVVANPQSYQDKEKRPLIDCLVMFLEATLLARKSVLVMANVPQKSLKKAARIMGGLKSPTSTPLMAKGWYSLQSVVKKDIELKVISQLKDIGATDIIVMADLEMILV